MTIPFFLKAKKDRHILFPIYHVLVIILVKVIFFKKSNKYSKQPHRKGDLLSSRGPHFD